MTRQHFNLAAFERAFRSVPSDFKLSHLPEVECYRGQIYFGYFLSQCTTPCALSSSSYAARWILKSTTPLCRKEPLSEKIVPATSPHYRLCGPTVNDYYVMTPFPAGSFFYFCFTAPSARLKRKHVCSLPEKMEQPEIESRITACPFDLHLPIVHGRASKRPLTHHILPLPPVSLCTTAATASKSSRVPHFSPFVIWYHPPLFIFFFLFTAQNAGRTVCEETGSTNRRSASTWRTGRTRTVAQIEELRGDAGEGEEGSRTTTNKTNLKANQEGWEGARKGGGIMVVSHPLALPRLQRTMEQTALQERRSLRTVRAVPEPSRRYSERSYLLLLCYLTAFRHRPRRAERANLRRSSPRTAGRNSWQALDADGPRGGSVVRGGLISARLHGGRGGIPRIRLRPGPREGRRDGPEPRRRWSQLASPGGRRRDRRVVARWEESGGAARRETVGIVQNFRVHRCYLSSTATRVGGIVHELKEETLWKGRDKQE